MMKSPVLTICFVMVFSSSVSLYTQYYLEPAKPTVAISEICFWPNENEPEWIELKNISPNSVDISAWQITNGRDFVFAFPSSLPLMPSQAYVLIILDGKPKTSNDLSFKNDNLVVLHGPNEIPYPSDPNKLYKDILGDTTMGECALYAAGPRNANTIKSFVTWGSQIHSSTQAVEHAAVARIWTDLKLSLYVKGDRIGGSNPIVFKGGTLGLYGNSRGTKTGEWIAFKSVDATPGSENILLEPALFGISSCRPSGMPFSFSWRYVTGAVCYHAQVCEDIECKSIISEKTGVSEESYKVSEGSPAGSVYFVRVRAIDAKGKKSKWSKVHKIKVINIPESWKPLFKQD